MPEQNLEIDPITPQIQIQAAVIPRLNLAASQNSVPLLRELRVQNLSLEQHEHLTLRIESQPPFLTTKTYRFEVLRPQSTYEVSDLTTDLDASFFSKINEAEPAKIRFHLEQDGNAIAQTDVSVDLLPRNHWGGLTAQPEMLAAFIQPNDSAVERILRSAIEVLHTNDKNANLNGYDDGSMHAWEIGSAIWTAIAGLGLGYVLPPASFEQHGQKIRGPSQIVESGLATCLDLTLFFAAALEQAGLHPLVVVMQGHAFVGYWLRPGEFSTTIVDDVAALRNRIRLNHLVVFESTLATNRPAPSFHRAIEVGTDLLADGAASSFELLLDVQRCRLQKIKPLSGGANSLGTPAEELRSPSPPSFAEPPKMIEHTSVESEEIAFLAPKDRIDRWQRRLLDLSLRNSLLNFKQLKKSLKLEAPDPGRIEDLLAAGKSLRLLPRPDFLEGRDERNRQLFEATENVDSRRELAKEALRKQEILIATSEADLDDTLLTFFRGARLALQEGGANTLFLALGFLIWTRSDRPEQKLKAPLILLPVTLERKTARSPFTLKLHEDEPRFNPTLMQMLRQDHHIDLGIKEGELPKDESGLDVKNIWNRVSTAIKDTRGWEISEDVVLSTFSFAKYLMWKDLVDRTETLRENAVVRHLVDTPRARFESTVPFLHPRELDDICEPSNTFCPLPVDSSQLSAIMTASRGKDFVLIGPPGTGKSQTIANLIAQSLAEGKRVLFVAEKIAALNVVYRRLQQIGLSDFCLELHSNKASKVEILKQLQKSWDASGMIDPAEWAAKATKLKQLRDRLNQYVKHLHRQFQNGLTIYRAIGTLLSAQTQPNVSFHWPHAEFHTSTDRDKLKSLASLMESKGNDLGWDFLCSGILAPIRVIDWGPQWQQAFISSVSAWKQAMEQAIVAFQGFSSAAGFPLLALSEQQRDAMIDLVGALRTCAGRDCSFLVADDAKTILAELRQAVLLIQEHRTITASFAPAWSDNTMRSVRLAISHLEELKSIRAALPAPWSPAVEREVSEVASVLEQLFELKQKLSCEYAPELANLNVNSLLREYRKFQKAIWPFSWLGPRQISRQLESVALPGAKPDVRNDLELLNQIRGLETKMNEYDISVLAGGIWKGARTKPIHLRSLLKLQSCLNSVSRSLPWETGAMDDLLEGVMGDPFAQTAKQLRKLHQLEAQCSQFDSLEEATYGVWKGVETPLEQLKALADFRQDVAGHYKSGFLRSQHPIVESGACGIFFTEECRRFKQRESVEASLQSFLPLTLKTASLWQGLETNEEVVTSTFALENKLREKLSALATSEQEGSRVLHSLRALLDDSNLQWAPGAKWDILARDLTLSFQNLRSAFEAVVREGRFALQDIAFFSGSGLEVSATAANGILNAERRLRSWCAWQKAKQEAESLGLGPLTQSIEIGKIPQGSVLKAFEVNYCRWWLNTLAEVDDVLKSFISTEHEAAILEFRELDAQFTETTRQWIRANLCAGMPKASAASEGPDWGVLRHEIAKKKGHMPLRELMSTIPDVVTKLTPCFLMSPLSIAQYLDASTSSFDLVVFDEASQIPVWDAIGAMARGKQVVVVGDPKQLPPTSFFDRAESDVDTIDEEADLESILDECLSSNIDSHKLSWHYRSKYENLIAFSNHRYYDGELVTFPSPATRDEAVSFNFVEGIYAKGKSRTNRVEAEALVADLVGLLKSPGFLDSPQSIGVVTFNKEQQKLIEDLLDAARRQDPSIETHFSEDQVESVFVKNLESVQGDERDIMYFSITYGPDDTKAFSMNFGPLNRAGGGRRLNVAITRARHELKVFASFRPEQLDLSRTPAPGVKDLKHFLEFAQRGVKALAESTPGSLGGVESPFEQAVASGLTSKGWNVQTQIGASSFRIDLAIVHPTYPGKFLAGIECDGATYHRSATARDRDKLREQVLRGLGWEIIRIWSTDWWVDSAGTLEKLHTRLVTLAETR